jgi:hydrogenase maturation protease
MSEDATPVLIIGIGNVYCSDDGAGIATVRQLKDQLRPGVRVLEESGEGTRLLEAWKNASLVILIDAVHSGARAGTIRRLDARTEKIPAELFRCSSHAFSLAQAIELARVLNELPRDVIVYGIEGQNFEAGEGLSRSVEEAVGAVVSQVLRQVDIACEARRT